MKKHYLVAMLVIMIGISAAASDKNPGKKEYSFSEMSLNPAIVSSDDKVRVIIKDNSFQPSEITIAAGSKVEWHNQDEAQHTVVSDDPGSLQLSSGPIMPGKKYSFAFNTPGVYGYHCSIQKAMRGKIVVKGDSEADKGSKKGSASPSWNELPIGRVQTVAKGPLSTGSQSAGKSLQMQITNPAIASLPVYSAAQTSAGEASSQIDLQKFSSYYIQNGCPRIRGAAHLCRGDRPQ